MAACERCGAELETGRNFCPSCGAAAGGTRQPEAPQAAPARSDADKNKVMGLLAYLTWLVLIPLFAAKDSPFARYHTNQGLVLWIVQIIWSIIMLALGGLLGDVLSSIIDGVAGIAFLALIIIGVIHAVKGEMKPLPIIGGVQLLK